MKLAYLQVENFRQYFGRQRIQFSRNEQRNVTVIHGINGEGKTSLFLALNWCLYGRSVENIRVVENVGELVNKEALAHTAVGGNVCASVEVCFLHDGDRYQLRRAVNAVKSAANNADSTGPEEYVMMRTGADGQAVTVANPIGTLNAILPVNVREYFLFNAEKIDHFARPEAASQVKEAIRLVLKLEVLDRAKGHLLENARVNRSNLKNISGPELRSLIEQEEQARAQQQSNQQRIEELKSENSSAKNKIEDVNSKLSDIQHARLLQERRRANDDLLKQHQKTLQSTMSKIRELATGAHFVAARPAIETALRVLDAKRERGEIPSSIRQQFVQDLLDQEQCICGRCITPQSAESERLVRLMRGSLPSTLENDILETGMALHGLLTRTPLSVQEINQAMINRVQLIEKIEVLDAQQDDISRQLKLSPLEEISRLEAQRQGFQRDIDSNLMEIGSCEQKVAASVAVIKKLEEQLASAKIAQARQRLLNKKVEIAQQAADAIEDVYDTYAGEMRGKIEAKTNEIFRRLVWKENHFQDVQISSDYHLEVIDRYGLHARPELSAGERQVLSLAFIAAMSRVSDEEAPLVIDTPFGRLSSQHRSNITMHLPQLASQLVLFVTDEELRDEARDNLQSRIGAEYRLEFDHSTSCTQIVEVL